MTFNRGDRVQRYKNGDIGIVTGYDFGLFGPAVEEIQWPDGSKTMEPIMYLKKVDED